MIRLKLTRTTSIRGIYEGLYCPRSTDYEMDSFHPQVCGERHGYNLAALLLSTWRLPLLLFPFSFSCSVWAASRSDIIFVLTDSQKLHMDFFVVMEGITE